MRNNYGTIVIGAGPAGLFCALNACCENNGVFLAEKNASPGRKLLLSGSGQCNFSHIGGVEHFVRRYGAAGNFVKPALHRFTSDDLCRFLESGGVKTIAREDGKLFPADKRAGEVLSLLLHRCSRNGVAMRFNSRVASVSRDGSSFYVRTDDGGFHSRFLVIACGGTSYPETGSSGDGHALAESLGHTVVPVTPALVAVHVKEGRFGELAGISVRNSFIAVHRAGRKVTSGQGDILFTRNGLSGPGILDLSRSIAGEDTLHVSLTGLGPGDTETRLAQAVGSGAGKSARNILRSLGMPERLADAVLAHGELDPSTRGAELGKNRVRKLLELVTRFPFTVREKGGFDTAMATAGGVSREEINRNTMESRIQPNLFFAGEVIDVDGDTGGYNIQWAFSSGMAAAETIRARAGSISPPRP